MNVKCVFCKGRLYCGRPYCPIIAKISHMRRRMSTLKKEYEGEAPNIFVGRFGYPNVNIGILSVEEYNEHDEPLKWAKKWYSINKIIGLREELINSGKRLSVLSPSKQGVASLKDVISSLSEEERNKKKEDKKEEENKKEREGIREKDSRFNEQVKEIAMAYKPAEVEIKLADVPQPKLSFNQYIAPTNIATTLSRLRIIENTKIKRAVEKVNEEKDMKANEAIDYLMKKGYDEYSIQRLLAGGILGTKSQRRFVPTRWAITATDDIMGKKLKERIKEYKEANYRLYFGGYLGNYYLIMFFPGAFAYELYEMAIENKMLKRRRDLKEEREEEKGKEVRKKEEEEIEEENNRGENKGIRHGSIALYVPRYVRDYEGFRGRSNYAEDTAGGYYAARFSILKKLNELKRRASVLALRFVTKEYWAPLGVWVVREAVKKTLEKRGIKFESQELMLEYAYSLAERKFGVALNELLKNSFILNTIAKQKTLDAFS